MRVTRIPGDHHDIGDKPCRVWCNEVEILEWIVADDFRRVVISPGKTYQFLEDAEPKQAPDTVRYGAVRIDMAQGVTLPDDVVIMIDGEVVKREPVADPISSVSQPIPSDSTVKPVSRKQRRGR
jgi:hypothetical protein